MNNIDTKVSIIVPVYNGEPTIARCIESILLQTLQEIELIVVDDGSTDKTPEICATYHDSRFIYHRKPNGGVSSARNVGISLAHGEYIGFVDADDYISLDFCQKMYEASSSTISDICMCDYHILYDNGERTTYTDSLQGYFFDKSQIHSDVLSSFLGHIDSDGNIAKNDWAIIRRLFRRRFLHEQNLLFDESLSNSEDCLFAYLATHKANGMVYLKNEFLYFNIRNSQSLTRRYLKDYWIQRCRIIDELETVINQRQPAWSTTSFPLFVMRCVRPSFTNIAYGFHSESVFSSVKQFYDIVHDSRVRKACCAMDNNGLNDEWRKLFSWCKHKRYFTLYFYYMDVYQKNKICHFIRRVQKGLERRLKPHQGY